ncbi:hypothetical protein HDV05_003523 [Chytridiales sp. JEL 0842]|nr:hypothetical protein HDV05_003523 [Chytridiales sp. JEL 0842]
MDMDMRGSTQLDEDTLLKLQHIIRTQFDMEIMLKRREVVAISEELRKGEQLLRKFRRHVASGASLSLHTEAVRLCGIIKLSDIKEFDEPMDFADFSLPPNHWPSLNCDDLEPDSPEETNMDAKDLPPAQENKISDTANDS